jgi:hypothetical protein
MINNLELCQKLIRAEREEEVRALLEEAGYWNQGDAWRYYGDNENNYSTIGNQQSSPESALVEKIVNSVDAVLMRECLRQGTDPEGPDAPQSVSKALDEYFDIKHGLLAGIGPGRRSALARNIILVATGSKESSCYSIADLGEGQTPTTMPETFLSLTKSNKLRIPFVQGKYNMGGTGALRFCGHEHNFQLVVSKRDPRILDAKGRCSQTDDAWGFTVVRRNPPSKGRRSSSYTYLAPLGKILDFQAAGLPVMPGAYPSAYEGLLQWGTYIKLYEYQLKGYKTVINFDLYYRLSELLANIALPITMYERRPGYSGHTFDTVLSGLSVRLEDDRYENIEKGFPSSSSISVNSQEMTVQVFAFKEDRKRHYARDDGVVFTVNGQAHGFLPKAFFRRRSVGMEYLADEILLIVDCSKLDVRTREDLFMNSRDRLCEGEFKSRLEEQLENLVREHHGLRELRERRRREKIEGRLVDEKPLAEILEKAIRKSPVLASLLMTGQKITNPLKLIESGTQDEFKGKRFPTFFKLRRDFPRQKPKSCQRGKRCRIEFDTDASNDYFSRDSYRGEIILSVESLPKVPEFSMNLWDGTAVLTLSLPEQSEISQVFSVSATITDPTRVDPFQNEFYLCVAKPTEPKGGGNGVRRRSSDDSDEGDARKPSGLSLPPIVEVYQKDWETYKFTRDSALCVKDNGEGSYDFYLNMDNKYLLAEMKARTSIDPRILRAQYKYAFCLIGLCMVKALEGGLNEEQNPQIASLCEEIGKISEAISPVVIPIVLDLGELATE